jgi:hypothetical protein
MKKKYSEIVGNIVDWISIIICGGILIGGGIYVIIKLFF